MTCKIKDSIIKEQETIRDAESCGLTYTGDKKEPFIGDNKAWAKFNDGDFGNEFINLI